MPIVEITDAHIVQRCASCDEARELSVDELMPEEDSPSLQGGVLQLPACVCGATEFLVHAPEGEPPHPAPGSFGHLHRLAIDALVDEVKLRATKRDVRTAVGVAIATRVGSSAMRQWFPGGLKVERPVPSSESSESSNGE